MSLCTNVHVCVHDRHAAIISGDFMGIKARRKKVGGVKRSRGVKSKNKKKR